MKTRSEVEEVFQKLLDYEYKKMWESLVLYGQYPPPPERPRLLDTAHVRVYPKSIWEGIRENNEPSGNLSEVPGASQEL
jgi:hypothetical protein